MTTLHSLRSLRRFFANAGFCCLLSIVSVALSAGDVVARTFYVDFESGNDLADGLTRESAWKHAPGDPNASGAPARLRLSAGDEIVFRGGVAYRGSIDVSAKQAMSGDVSYIGDAWGDAPAVMTGLDPIDATVARCATASMCFDNPNWSKLSLLELEAPMEELTAVFVNQRRVLPAQSMELSDPFWLDNVYEYHELSQENDVLDNAAGRLELAAAPPWAQADDWGDAKIAYWIAGNWLAVSPIESADRGGARITFEPRPRGRPHRKGLRVAILNRPSDVSRGDEFASIYGGRALLVWSEGLPDAALNRVQVPTRMTAFKVGGAARIVIRGFDFVGYGDSFDGGRGGSIIDVSGDGRARASILGNRFRLNTALSGAAALAVKGVEAGAIEGNIVTLHLRGRGAIISKSKNLTFKANHFKRIGGTGLMILDVSDVSVVGNLIEEIWGIHSNGIAAYLKNQRLLFAHNRILDAKIGFAMHGPKQGEPVALDIWLVGNVIKGPTRSWGSNLRKVFVLNNLFDSEKVGIAFHETDRDIHFFNNIAAGMAAAPTVGLNRSHNLYSHLSFMQTEKRGWRLADGERVVELPVGEIASGRREELLASLPIGRSVRDLIQSGPFASELSGWIVPRPIGPNASKLPSRL